ncbi:MAG: molecular chaperone [Pedobacter sp.]|nr:MAG: molecular chaperone [Pedobacter sp.]
MNLANVGKDSATFMISFIQIRMKDDGTFEKITEPDSAQRFADKYIRFYPRTVTLAPNESQTVKMQITKASEMLPGEYRSHLYFRAVPTGKPLGEKEPAADSLISINIVPVFGISMPVIIRVGETDAQIQLSELALRESANGPALDITFQRSGNMSVYGDVVVDHISSTGQSTRVGNVNGLAVYSPNPKRKFRLALNPDKKIDYHSGRLPSFVSAHSVVGSLYSALTNI